MFYKPVWEYEGYQLVERPDTPYYYIYWKPPRSTRSRRKSTSTGDLRTAQRLLVEFAKSQSRPLRRTPDRVPLLEVMCDYVQERTKTDVAYVPAARGVLKHITRFIEQDGIEYVSDFTLDAQQRYVDWRRAVLLEGGHGASNGTMNRELGVVKAAMRWSWKRGRLESVPAVQMLPAPPPRDRFLRLHEVRRLLEACDKDHLRLYVMLALHTLQRPSAIFSLRVEQVDLEWNRIDFLPAGSIQSNKRRPVVPITPSLRSYLEVAIECSESGYVLEFMGHPICSVKGAFRTACRRAGLQDVTPYTLRHTGATLMAAGGVPMRQIAGMLGHTETRTTEIYAKHHPDFLSDAARSLERMFGEQRALPSMSDGTHAGERSPWETGTPPVALLTVHRPSDSDIE